MKKTFKSLSIFLIISILVLSLMVTTTADITPDIDLNTTELSTDTNNTFDGKWPYAEPESVLMFKAGSTGSNKVYNWPSGTLSGFAIENKDGVNKIATTFPANFSAGTHIGVDIVGAANKDALIFSVDVSGLTDKLVFKMQFELNGGNDRYIPAENSEYYLKNADSTVERLIVNNKNGLVEIPAGFKGEIALPLDSAKLTSIKGTGEFKSASISALTLILQANTNLNNGKFYLSGFGFTLVKVEEEAPEDITWPYADPENFVVLKDGTPASNQIYNWNTTLKKLAIEKKGDVNAVALTFPSNFTSGSSICIPITATSEKDAMIFSVDASGLTDKMQVIVQYENGSKDSFVLSQGSEYYLRSSADSTVQKLFVDNAKGYVAIPAGFVGEVAISLDAAKLTRTRGSLEFSTAAISSLTLTISGNSALNDGNVYFSKFGYTVVKTEDDTPLEEAWPYKTPQSFVVFKDGTPASNQIYNWNTTLKKLAIEKKGDVNAVALTFPSNFTSGSSICIPITATSEKDAMIFSVDASGLTDKMQVIVQYENGSKDSFVLSQGSEYYLRSSADSTVQKLVVDNAKGYVAIPAGFVGEVAISLDAAKLTRTRGSLEFSTAAISSLTLTISGNSALSDGNVYFSKFGYTVLGADDDEPEAEKWPYKNPKEFVMFKDGTPASNQIYNWNTPLKNLAIEKKGGVNAVALTFPSNFNSGSSICIPITATSNKDALIFSVDASGLKDTMQVIVQYENGSKDSFVLSQGSEYYLRSSADSTVQKLFVDNTRGYVAIPAGFVGDVAISLDAAKLTRTRGSLEFSTAAISSLTLTISGNSALSDGKVYFSKFGYTVEGVSIPQTGDNGLVWIYSIVAFASLAGLVLLLKKNNVAETQE